MSIIDAIIQAVVQGLTEFLPVSSSGHLSLMQHFSGVNGDQAVFFSILLHVGTLIAVFLAFRVLIGKLLLEFFHIIKDIFTLKFSLKQRNPERNMIVMLFVSLLPLLPFYLFKDFFKSIVSDSDIIVEGICFLYTAAILFLSDRCIRGRKGKGEITYGNALTIGVFQGVALLPGVSRSGSTISAALFCGLTRETAVQFSFILGIPAILGGGISEFTSVSPSDLNIGVAPIVIGLVVSALVGFLAIKMVEWLIKSNKFKVFAVYTAVLGVLVIAEGVFEHIVGQTIFRYLFG